ncbi:MULTISPECIES: hypothetical protein [Klebsiella]|uniref:Uncharacterized protein n=1 Tax=Klebsiella michiganensis TaxID=1134687 RepID=A0AB35W5T3_9ENTR|nr:hypothetical protein [Klebsiella michiganensis]MDU1206946.1 hypothetical protein [Klebsiella michiganensis]MEC6049517.1 hypothetical protein [Klebsiella michiganensis]UHD04700.1 hypothetical protein LUW94_25585 [Klebsiella michiganensis]
MSHNAVDGRPVSPIVPLAFGGSVVDSHSSVLYFNLPYEAKTPAIAGRSFVKS